MKTYKSYEEEILIEAIKPARLEHVEDLHLHGPSGFNHALAALNALHRGLSGEKNDTTVTKRYDGTPVVFGHHPTTGKFFVGTKFSRLNYTHADVDKHHALDGLKGKMKAALTHLPKVTPHGVYGGDILHAGMKSVDETGEKLSITPNTTKYTIKKGSEHGKKMMSSQLGIVPHTRYHGKTVEDMVGHPIVDYKAFKSHPDVHMVNPSMSLDHAKYDHTHQHSVRNHLDKAREKYNEVGPEIAALPTEQIRHYIAHTVRTGETPMMQGLLANVTQRHHEGRVSKAQHALVKYHIENNPEPYKKVIEIYKHLKATKHTMMRALDSDESGFEHSLSHSPAHAEGYTVHHNGKMVKLTDRDAFSRANFGRRK